MCVVSLVETENYCTVEICVISISNISHFQSSDHHNLLKVSALNLFYFLILFVIDT